MPLSQDDHFPDSTEQKSEFTEHRGAVLEQPLSFAEFVQKQKIVSNALLLAWDQYLTYGGLPEVVALLTNEEKQAALSKIYDQAIKAVAKTNSIANLSGLTWVAKIIAANEGELINAPEIHRALLEKSQQRFSLTTVRLYIECLRQHGLIDEVRRFDIRNRKLLGSMRKFYFTDTGLRQAALGFPAANRKHSWEAVIGRELRRRGFSVATGMLSVRPKNPQTRTYDYRQLTIDFVAAKETKRVYLQGVPTLTDEETLVQKKASLHAIKDVFPKGIVTGDFRKPNYDADGIWTMSLFDFLLKPNSLDF